MSRQGHPRLDVREHERPITRPLSLEDEGRTLLDPHLAREFDGEVAPPGQAVRPLAGPRWRAQRTRREPVVERLEQRLGEAGEDRGTDQRARSTASGMPS